MACAWMQGPREEGGKYKISQCTARKEMDNGIIENELRENVEEVEVCEGDFVNEHRT